MAEYDVIGTLAVRVEADTKPLRQTVERAATQSGDSAGKAWAQRFGDKISQQAKDVAKVAAGAFAGAAVFDFAKQSVAAYSEVQDATDALKASFGASGEAMTAWAKRSGDAFNLSQAEALKAAQSFAIFGQSAGKSGADLESFATTLAERAADAASYFGTTTQEAIQAFGSALRGEAEPARRFGVLLDDMTLRQKALEMGIVSSIQQALTPQQKVLAANAVLLEQTARVQGDVERTSGSMGNTIKDAAQKWADFQAEAGRVISTIAGPLLKALSAGLAGLTGLASMFADLPGPVQAVTVALGAFAVAAKLGFVSSAVALAKSFGETWRFVGAQAQAAGVQVGFAGKAMEAAKVQAAPALQAMKGVGFGLTAIGTAAVIAVPYLDQLKAKITEVAAEMRGYGKQSVNEMALALRDLANTSTGSQLDAALSGFQDALAELSTSSAVDYLRDLGSQLQGVPSRTEQARNSVDRLDQALVALYQAGNTEEAQRIWDALLVKAKAAGMQVDDLKALFNDYTDAVAGSKLATDSAADAENARKAALFGLGGAIAGVLNASKELAAVAGASAAADAKAQTEAHKYAVQSRMRYMDSVDAAKYWLREQTRILAAMSVSDKGYADQKATVLKAQIDVNNALIDKQREAAEAAKAAAKAQTDANAQIGDIRFEASLRGLDDVAAAYQRLQRAKAALAATKAGTEDNAAARIAEAQAQVAYADAQYQAAERTRQAVEEARRALMDSMPRDFVKTLIGSSPTEISSQLGDIVTQVRATFGNASGSLVQFLAASNEQLVTLAEQRAATITKLEGESARLKALKDAQNAMVNEMRANLQGSTVGMFNDAAKPVTTKDPNTGKETTRAPSASEATSALKASLAKRLTQIRQFGADLKALAARGLPQYLLNEVIDAGLDDGAAFARALAASNDWDFKSIVSAARAVWTASKEVAKSTGDTMYGAAAAQAQKVVDGLRSKKNETIKAMAETVNLVIATVKGADRAFYGTGQNIGAGLASGLQSMESQVAAAAARLAQIAATSARNTLKVKSPSRVFADIGRNVGLGMVQGMDSTHGRVQGSMNSLLQLPSVGQRSRSALEAAAARQNAVAPSYHVTVNNPVAQTAETSVHAALARTAWLLGGVA